MFTAFQIWQTAFVFSCGLLNLADCVPNFLTFLKNPESKRFFSLAENRRRTEMRGGRGVHCGDTTRGRLRACFEFFWALGNGEDSLREWCPCTRLGFWSRWSSNGLVGILGFSGKLVQPRKFMNIHENHDEHQESSGKHGNSWNSIKNICKIMKISWKYQNLWRIFFSRKFFKFFWTF